MAQVMLQGPDTRRNAYTGLNFDWSALEWEPLRLMKTDCPAGGNEHNWNAENAYLRADGAGD